MAKIICNVVELPVQCAWPVDETEGYPRDILPWADPYIAQLLRQQQKATAAIVTSGNEVELDDDLLDEFFSLDAHLSSEEQTGSDWNDRVLPDANDSPYEWDAFRFRGEGIL
jgi:hypothetical protein